MSPFQCEGEKAMIQQVSFGEAQAHLLELMDAALKGKTVLITQGDQQAVQLVPVTQPARRHFGSAQGQIVMADDFDAPLSDFNECMA